MTDLNAVIVLTLSTIFWMNLFSYCAKLEKRIRKLEKPLLTKPQSGSKGAPMKIQIRKVDRWTGIIDVIWFTRPADVFCWHFKHWKEGESSKRVCNKHLRWL